jgi:hypothetical protein
MFGRLLEELTAAGATAFARADTAESNASDVFYLSFDPSPSDWMLALGEVHRASTLARTVFIGTDRPPSMFKSLEDHRVAAGIDTLTQTAWQNTVDTGYGIAGRHDVVDAIKGQRAGRPFESDHYCIYKSATQTKLVPALVEYLEALQPMLKPRG